MIPYHIYLSPRVGSLVVFWLVISQRLMVPVIIHSTQWPGYEAWSKSFHILDNDQNPINRARLAFAVANAVDQFMNVRLSYCRFVIP